MMIMKKKKNPFSCDILVLPFVFEHLLVLIKSINTSIDLIIGHLLISFLVSAYEKQSLGISCTYLFLVSFLVVHIFVATSFFYLLMKQSSLNTIFCFYLKTKKIGIQLVCPSSLVHDIQSLNSHFFIVIIKLLKKRGHDFFFFLKKCVYIYI